jgi:glucokinase
MDKWLCGVDLGGTKLAVVLTNEEGSIRDKIVVHDHVRKTDHEIVPYIADLINTLLVKNSLNEMNLHGIGVCFPGHIRFKAGITITTSNLPGFKNFPLKQAIQEHFQTNVIVDNDANAQTYAEFKYGAGKGYESMIFMTISSGIGGGIIIDNKLYRGMTGTAGEFGHIIIDPHSPIQCGCGNYGCLMGCASGLSLPQVFQKYLAQGYKTELKIDNPAAFDGRMLKMGVERHDELCEKVVTEYAEYIGIGVYNLFQIFDPPVIVLGGGLMKLGEDFFQKIQEAFRTFVKEMLYDPIAIVLSKLGDDAGAIGVAALLLEDHE